MSAARRVTKSAIDWASLATKTPAAQKESFRVLKGQTDRYVSKVADLPAELPKIDFAEYRRRITDTAFVTEFEKMYSALQVPYPKDPDNNMKKIQGDEAVALKRMDEYVAQRNRHLKALEDVLATIESIPPPEKMTMQMFNHYFPDAAINPNRENPGFNPHCNPIAQIDQPEFGIHYLNTSKDKRNIPSIPEFEEMERVAYETQKLERAKQQAEKKAKTEQIE